MASIANPVAGKGKGKALLALACMLAMLIALVPCAMALPAAHVAAMPMSGMACAHCCSNAGSSAGPVMHCTPPHQPAEIAAIDEVPHNPKAVTSLPALDRQSTLITDSRVQASVLTPPLLTPPLLHPILRI